MTLEQIKAIPGDVLTAEQVASVLGFNPQSIRRQAKTDPSQLCFPVSVIGSRVVIPKAGFINWMEGENMVFLTNAKAQEMESELNALRRGYQNMIAEHGKALDWAREIRDRKDAEILQLHAEIEALKNDRERLRRENDRLRQAVSYYERRKGTNDNN